MTDEVRKQFPILGSGGAKIDWQLVADHGKQANKNHYQTVQRLADRGGLSWCELHAVLHNREWRKMDENQAILECRALEARYLSNSSPVTKALREALEWIDYHKDDPDMSHVNFRVEAGSRAYDALVAQPIEGKE